MSLYEFFMYGSLILSVLVILLHVYAAWLFRINKKAYQDFINRYQSAGLQLDLTTKVANYLGFYANYQKIAFFMNLRKGRKMRFSKTENVSTKAYDFVQKQPKENMAWMEKILNLYQLTFILTFTWVVFMAVFIYVFN
ncbi:hypothetical protein CBF17_019965 [Pantoea agglomerans]|uniref:hypothetical protein n=1 Tax=Enterobacter agglomerans TaxID=549 RepID=UPI000B346168|nr:hypothetical protein [Pantoea agglomerans]PHP92046.1 hypothetical protein CBF17_019965 [Pantoea agglomerans]